MAALCLAELLPSVGEVVVNAEADEVAKFAKNAPGPAQRLEQLRTELHSRQAECARWKQHAAAGREKANARLATQQAALDALIAQCNERKQAVNEAHPISELI